MVCWAAAAAAEEEEEEECFCRLEMGLRVVLTLRLYDRVARSLGRGSKGVSKVCKSLRLCKFACVRSLVYQESNTSLTVASSRRY